ncbi:MAG: TIGR04282 family arsenosugar biosynthesis glycosyltransferase [Pseudomonadota bacterium]
MKPHLIVFVKEPRPGRVKTRLGRKIGMTGAAWWFRHQTRALLRRLARDPRWVTVLAVSPDAEGRASRCWPRGVRRWPQGRGDLGARMARALRGMPPGPAMVIGADIPGIRPRHIADTLRLLGRHDAVLGPAPDGGYWLIGLKRGAQAVPAGIFQNVRWSSEHAREDTEASLGLMTIAHAATLRDVDTAADLVVSKRE